MKRKLLLHSCCAPCSTSVIEQLKDEFDITIYYYNPCIFPLEEYEKRKNEQKKLLKILNIPLLDCDYESEKYYEMIKGLEKEKEGGRRCEKCFEQRLEKTAKTAKEENFDIFCTTLTVSPHKNAILINKIGNAMADKYNVPFLPSDFKKKDGYKKSIEFSKKYELYRQNYCGCEFSIYKEKDE